MACGSNEIWYCQPARGLYAPDRHHARQMRLVDRPGARIAGLGIRNIQ